MRTITIDDAVLEDLKRRAAQRGTIVSRVIEDFVRLARIAFVHGRLEASFEAAFC